MAGGGREGLLGSSVASAIWFQWHDPRLPRPRVRGKYPRTRCRGRQRLGLPMRPTRSARWLSSILSRSTFSSAVGWPVRSHRWPSSNKCCEMAWTVSSSLLQRMRCCAAPASRRPCPPVGSWGTIAGLATARLGSILPDFGRSPRLTAEVVVQPDGLAPNRRPSGTVCGDSKETRARVSLHHDRSQR